MPKSRKRNITKKKPKKRGTKPYEVIKQRLVKMENNFFPDETPFEKRIEFLVEIGNKAMMDYESNYQSLLNYFNEYDPLYLCSFSAFHFMRQKEGIDEEAIKGSLEFPPFYIEILQCISLMQERNISWNSLQENVEDFKSTITKLNTNQSYTYFELAKKAKNQNDIGAIMLRTEMMTHTLAVRNWAYIQQMEITAFELANLITDKFISKLGFNPKNFLHILFSLVSLIEEKLNNHIRRIRLFLKAKTYNDIFDRYEESFEKAQKTNSVTRLEVWNKYGKNTKFILCNHSDLFLSDIFTLSSYEIYNHLSKKISEKEICYILDKISLRFGDLSAINKDFIFLDNPIHSKPFIKIDDDKYFSVIPHMFSHLGVDLLERFISEDANLKKEYAAKKGKFLERKVEKLFRDSFPTANIFSGSLWNCPIENKDFENDLVILIEEFAVIVECKSGTVSPPARRGATDRLFKTLQELVVEPSEQAIRFVNYLKQHNGAHEFQTKSGEINNIDTTKIKYYVPVGITLSNLGSIGCNLKKLIDAKIISYKLEQLAPSIGFTDLEIIFEILSLEAEKIHYLSRRREFEAHLSFQGDEMDLFCFYLDHGFNIGDAEYDKSMHIDLTLKSKEIDPYFIGKQRGVDVKKPCLLKTKYWDDILKKRENKGNNWLMASYILLNMPKEDQLKYEKSLKKLTKMILDNKCEKKHNFSVMYFGPERRQYV